MKHCLIESCYNSDIGRIFTEFNFITQSANIGCMYLDHIGDDGDPLFEIALRQSVYHMGNKIDVVYGSVVMQSDSYEELCGYLLKMED